MSRADRGGSVITMRNQNGLTITAMSTTKGLQFDLSGPCCDGAGLS